MTSSNIAINIKNLRKDYSGKNVLNGIDFEIQKGEVIGYIGSNGAGKSTTVKIMLGLIDDFYGSVEVLGQNISENNEYKRKIGYVPEVADLYDALTAKEFFEFVGSLYGLSYEEINRKAKAMMEIFNISDVYESRISSYSKGMRQKVVIISSLLHNPDILFFDEPLAGLDANAVMIFKDIIKSLAQRGKTIFYSSHIMEVVERVSDRIILIDKGTIVADGSFEELKEKENEGSLEEVFNKLTGFTDHKELSDELLSVLED